MKSKAYFVQLSILIGLISGCTTLTAAKTENTDGGYFKNNNPRSIAQIMNDSNISGRINTAFYADPLINPFLINVDTYDGTVTLGGTVSSPTVVQRAVQIAQNTKGVKAVVPEFVIQPPVS